MEIIKMKKQIIILFFMTFVVGTVFAGKTVNKEPSPLSVLESEQERESWCETEGYAIVNNYGNLHYWLYSSYVYHNGDISEIIFEIVPKWFQSLGYFVVEDYQTVSPNNNLAESVKQLMDEQVCDVSITFIKGNNSYDNVIVNSFDPESELYTTYIFSGTKVDRAKVSSAEKIVTTNSSKTAWYDSPDLKEWREYLSKNISSDAQEYLFNYIQRQMDDGQLKFSNSNLNKYHIRAAEAALHKQFFGNYNKVPKNFKITGKLSETKLAELINKVSQ